MHQVECLVVAEVLLAVAALIVVAAVAVAVADGVVATLLVSTLGGLASSFPRVVELTEE